MKLHDLRPADRLAQADGPGSAAASRPARARPPGRGTKGQKARAGGSIPAWFEGGQTAAPHAASPSCAASRTAFKVRVRGRQPSATSRALVEARRVSRPASAGLEEAGQGSWPITVNQDDPAGGRARPRRLDKPLKVLGARRPVDAPLFVVADAFSASAPRSKIEAAGGTVNGPRGPDRRRAPRWVVDATTPRRPRRARRGNAAEATEATAPSEARRRRRPRPSSEGPAPRRARRTRPRGAEGRRRPRPPGREAAEPEAEAAGRGRRRPPPSGPTADEAPAGRPVAAAAAADAADRPTTRADHRDR